MIAAGHFEMVPLGCVSALSNGPATSQDSPPRHFIMMAGIGFDADAVRGVKDALKRRWGRAAYVIAGLRSFANYAAPPVRFRFEDKAAMAGYSAIVSNISRYAGSFRIAPDGALRQPWLNVCAFRRASRWSLLRYVVAIGLGRHTRRGDVICRRATCLEAKARPGAVPLQVDGDYWGCLPVRIVIEPARLRLYLPE